VFRCQWRGQRTKKEKEVKEGEAEEEMTVCSSPLDFEVFSYKRFETCGRFSGN
jgi:hypothetical protein